MTKSIITNSRDLLNAIAKMEREMNGISDNIRNLKSAKATINQPTNNQLLTWNSEISMVEDSLWQLPAADGAANEIMYTDGAGNLAWIAPGAAAVAGADTQVQYNAGGVMAAEAAFTYNYGTNTLTTDHIQATIDFTPSAADGASLGTAALEFSDLYLADGGIIYLGDDQDVTLTHIADTGIRINSTMQLQFRDAAIYIASLNDGHLDLEADTQIDLNSDAEVTGHLGVSIAPDTNYVILNVNDTITSRFLTARGAEIILHHNPSADYGTGPDHIPINVAGYPEGTHKIRDVFAGAWNFIAANNSNICRNYRGFSVNMQRNNSTMTFSGYAAMFELYTSAVAGVRINVAGNGYGFWIRDYTNIFTCAGTIYGIKQEGNTLHNNFEGSIEIDSDTNGLILGDGQDAGIYYDGSNLIYNSTLVGAGAHAFTGTVRLNTCVDAGTDTNKILVRDAANNIDYRTGAELLADLSGDAAASFDWNSQELDNVGWLGINTVASVDRYINIYDAALSFTSTFYGIYQSLTKTAGASDAGDDFYGFHNYNKLNQAGGTIGSTRGIYNEFQLDDGNIGDVSNTKNAMVSYNLLDLNGGKIWGPVYCGYFQIDQEAANEITGDAFGVWIVADLDGAVGGTAYMLYLDEASGIDYGIYQNGTAQNRLGGILDIWSSAKTIFLGANEGLNTRTDNTNKRCHIQCTQYDTDADGMAILATLCNVSQNLLLIGSRGSVSGNAPTAIYFYTSANTTAGAGAAGLGIESDGGVYLYQVKRGTDQADAGASADEIFYNTTTGALDLGS